MLLKQIPRRKKAKPIFVLKKKHLQRQLHWMSHNNFVRGLEVCTAINLEKNLSKIPVFPDDKV